MRNRVTTALLIGIVAVLAAGSGIAIAATTAHPAVHACSSKSNHRLGLLSHGKCAKGFKKVTLGAQGPRGKTGPQGPGATYQQQTVSNDDIQATIEHNVAGIAVHATCGKAANVSIQLAPASGTGTIEMYGTRSQGTVLNVVELPGVASFSASDSANVAFDVVARVGTGNFVDLHVSGFWLNNKCTITEVAVPTVPAT
jgi:uncharacterized low-complexity protein